jgi:hypothetical protein
MFHVKQMVVLAAMALVVGAAAAVTLVPDSSILPARLDTAISSKKSKPGEALSARIMQAVPLLAGDQIPAGTMLSGKITAVQAGSATDGGSITFRMDTLHLSHEDLHVTLHLRAVAAYLEVRQAQLPRGGSDTGGGPNSWTTVQVGGDVVYRGGGSVRNRSGVLGKPVVNGVLVRLDSNPARGCIRDGTGERAQALWVFSSDACGTYGLPDLTIVRPIPNSVEDGEGDITLKAAKGEVNVHEGSGLLLRVRSTTIPSE